MKKNIQSNKLGEDPLKEKKTLLSHVKYATNSTTTDTMNKLVTKALYSNKSKSSMD